ncbi:unnamed protein product [Rotaria sp. Silwood2]|nr:unnamed protein product [Rotaria sp. Silwood2]CAF3297845.1 unnamed protein product [Rotaria sp. Silwood2]CAF4030379.1 unnamed protein product [Rotaria sp. Silwood2]CAF4180486.1 unnamed protein product [Rotaria sp. Silwood2]
MFPNTANKSTAVPPPSPAGNNNNNNEFDQQNSLLRTLCILIELFLLCSITSVYLTFNRFVFVFLIFALLYLHCRSYLTIRQQRHVPQISLIIEQRLDDKNKYKI